MLEWVILTCIFLLVVGLTFQTVRFFTSSSRRIDDRLAQGKEEAGYDEQLLLGDLTQPLGTITSPSGEKQGALAQELREAGYYRPTAVVEYSALRAMLVAVPLLAGMFLAAIVDTPYILPVLGVGVAIAVLGYS